ncbi:hypothetical protein V5799_013228 [Amblyomma americanum]|uniref:Uncharacterized protein n=1 Tax=Amblyomma americanum TaxID=6943 RepID=A0AAQ4E6M5_AMBAM
MASETPRDEGAAGRLASADRSHRIFLFKKYCDNLRGGTSVVLHTTHRGVKDTKENLGQKNETKELLAGQLRQTEDDASWRQRHPGNPGPEKRGAGAARRLASAYRRHGIILFKNLSNPLTVGTCVALHATHHGVKQPQEKPQS